MGDFHGRMEPCVDASLSSPSRFDWLDTIDAALAVGPTPTTSPVGTSGRSDKLFAVADRHEERLMDSYRWGLIPSWSKDPKIGNRLFNARAEGLVEKPSFRTAFAKRPCAIPVDGFYEWDHRPGRVKQPHFFTRADGQPMVFAGSTSTGAVPKNRPTPR